MIKANKGTVELNGHDLQIMIELATVVEGIYYALTEHAGNEPEEARKTIMKAVKVGLSRKTGVEEVKAEKPGKKENDGLNTLLERIMDFLEDEEAEDADDYD